MNLLEKALRERVRNDPKELYKHWNRLCKEVTDLMKFYEVFSIVLDFPNHTKTEIDISRGCIVVNHCGGPTAIWERMLPVEWAIPLLEEALKEIE